MVMFSTLKVIEAKRKSTFTVIDLEKNYKIIEWFKQKSFCDRFVVINLRRVEEFTKMLLFIVEST